MVGVVAMWNEGRGFGFIQTPAHRLFVHKTQVTGLESLAPGDLVEFTRSDSQRGPRATGVKRLPSSCPKCDRLLRQIKCPGCGYLVA
jgi:cold shock CspA family protein